MGVMAWLGPRGAGMRAKLAEPGYFKRGLTGDRNASSQARSVCKVVKSPWNWLIVDWSFLASN